ncbi:winged helix-turn-helix domain-containing protein [Dyella choica]|nr:winged helix-turn-helix domain-containing protein [Dyella choica]
MNAKDFHFGGWLVEPSTCTLCRDGERVQVEPRAMDVLVSLCEQAGQVLSADELLRRCWPGVIVGENQVHKVMTQLRRALGDSAGQPVYIENVRKRGYRTLAQVSLAPGGATPVNSKGWSAGSPYVGLDAFSAEHASVFFGRDTAIQQLHAAVLAQVRTGCAFVLVLGPSGCGKTSLVQAGLLPALGRYDENIQVVASTTLDLGGIGDASLLTSLGAGLIDLDVDGKPLLEGHSADGLGMKLLQTPDAVLGALRYFNVRQPQARAVLFVDRLEAIFSAPAVEDTQRQQFLATLKVLARSGAFIVLAACRNDFYPHVAKQPLLMEAKATGGHFDLLPPTRAEIALMVRLPAEAAGLRFGLDQVTRARLDDVLCNDAANSPDALPLMQYTLQELYLQRDKIGDLTIAAYRRLGGIEGALGRRAETTLAGLPHTVQSTLPRILSLLVRLSASDDTVSGHHAPWSTLQNEAERALVNTLVEQRLFVSLIADEQPVFGVAHEALLRQWPRVAEWIAAHRQALRTRSRIESLTQLWLGDNRHVHRLLSRGRQLEEARELVEQTTIPLSAEVRAFIAASVRRVKHAERLRLLVVAAFAALGLVAGSFGLIAHRASIVAKQRQREAEGLMGYMLGELADKLRPLGKLDLLGGVGSKALYYLRQQRPEDLSPAAREQQALALQTIAEVARAHGNSDGARDALLQAKTLLDSNLAQHLESSALLKDLGADAFWLGQIRLDQGDLDGAERYFRQYLYYSDRMSAREPENVDAWIEVSYARNSLGSVARARGDEAGAAREFEASIQLKRRALTKHPNDRGLRAELADSLSWLASARQANGDLQEALSLYEQEQTELRALQVAAPAEYQWTYRLVAALQLHAELLINMGEDRQAAMELHSAEPLVHALLQHDADNRLWQRTAIKLDLLENMVLDDLGQSQQALSGDLAVATKLSALTRLDPKNTNWRTLEAATHIKVAESLLQLNHPEDALTQLSTALTMMKNVNGTKSLEQKQRIATGLILLARAENAKGQPALALDACGQALSLATEAFAHNNRDYLTLDPMVRANLCLGDRDKATPLINQLAQFGYRRTSYLDAIR